MKREFIAQTNSKSLRISFLCEGFRLNAICTKTINNAKNYRIFHFLLRRFGNDHEYGC